MNSALLLVELMSKWSLVTEIKRDYEARGFHSDQTNFWDTENQTLFSLRLFTWLMLVSSRKLARKVILFLPSIWRRMDKEFVGRHHYWPSTKQIGNMLVPIFRVLTRSLFRPWLGCVWFVVVFHTIHWAQVSFHIKLAFYMLFQKATESCVGRKTVTK